MASVAFPELSKTISVNDGTKYGYIKVEPKEGKPTLLFLHGVSICFLDVVFPVSLFSPPIPQARADGLSSIPRQAITGITK
jgi:hypothetical protein